MYNPLFLFWCFVFVFFCCLLLVVCFLLFFCVFYCLNVICCIIGSYTYICFLFCFHCLSFVFIVLLFNVLVCFTCWTIGNVRIHNDMNDRGYHWIWTLGDVLEWRYERPGMSLNGTFCHSRTSPSVQIAIQGHPRAFRLPFKDIPERSDRRSDRSLTFKDIPERSDRPSERSGMSLNTGAQDSSGGKPMGIVTMDTRGHP